MKIVFSLLLSSLLTVSVVSAQNEVSAKEPFSVDVVNPAPIAQKGNAGYLLSLTEQDFKNGNYVFYTDSNATIAHVRINGNDIRLTGGENGEHIMAYVCKDYTVTLSTNNADSHRELDNGKMEGMLVIYNSMGQVVGKKVTGTVIKAPGN